MGYTKGFISKVSPHRIMNTQRMFNELITNEGFTYIPNEDVFVNNGNYLDYSRYSVGKIEGDFFEIIFDNNHQLKFGLIRGINTVMDYLSSIGEENPMFGGWLDGNRLVIDPIELHNDLDTSKKLGKKNNQDYIFDFKIMDTIPL